MPKPSKSSASRRPSVRRKTAPRRPKAHAVDLPFANYAAATKWLYEHADLERTRPSRVGQQEFKLDRLALMLSRLGDPQDTLCAVHVGGTNGKGSIVAMLASALHACGYTIGTFTSPHLVDLRERIQINDNPISHPAFIKVLTDVASAALSIPRKYGPPTFFEIMTAAGFTHLAEQAVDVAVIEVGMGGRLDCTNLVTPVVAAVGSISLDHTHYLGETVEAIAAEKAGIFKEGVPALTFKQDKPILESMRTVAEANGTKLEVVGKDIDFSHRFEASPQLGPHCRVGLSTTRVNFEHVPVPLAGEHQAMNCGLVLAIIDRLVEHGLDLPEASVFRGLAETTIPGRMELVSNVPRIMLDGAHNAAAVEALVKSIGAHIAYDSMVMVFGCAVDKDVDEMLDKVALGADKVIFTKAGKNPRAAEPDDLVRRFEQRSAKMCQSAANVEEALSIASRAAGRDDLVVVTGSFYLVGEAKKLLTLRADRAERAAKERQLSKV